MDMSKITPFKLLTSREKALEIVMKHVKPIERKEFVPIERAVNRVLAKDLVAVSYTHLTLPTN